MINTFYYLVPKDYNESKKIKTEYFIIDSLIKKGINIIPIFTFKDIKKDSKYDGIIFNSLKIILKNQKILTYAKKNNIPIFWWYFDTAKIRFTRQRRVLKIAKQVSIFFNKDKDSFSDYLQSNINPIWLDQGVPSICNYTEIQKYDYDLSFFGSYEKSHSKRTDLLKEIDNKFNLIIYSKDYQKFLSNGFQNAKPFVPIETISKKIAKINLILNGDYNSNYCWSNRIHLIIGSGGFSLVEYVKGLENEYIDNQHCIYFNDKNDLVEKINFWLADNNNREEIRFNGYQHAHKEKRYEIKTNFFIQTINEFINNNHV